MTVTRSFALEMASSALQMARVFFLPAERSGGKVSAGTECRT